MLDAIKGLENAPLAPPAEEVSASGLLEALRPHTSKPLEQIPIN